MCIRDRQKTLTKGLMDELAKKLKVAKEISDGLKRSLKLAKEEAELKAKVAKMKLIALQTKDKELQEKLEEEWKKVKAHIRDCLLYTSPSPRDLSTSRMPSSA
eukprot:TRINITY_DN1012_c0_g1_i2.p1 TRINITY_DN1012_c0_g1~~TRINITY_DN1012_c0_g1_i2.p1  ORF type:complete len:103 (+),score=65.87 TRINITY_DN1012_c0_g1_i2:64-372(+)